MTNDAAFYCNNLCCVSTDDTSKFKIDQQLQILTDNRSLHFASKTTLHRRRHSMTAAKVQSPVVSAPKSSHDGTRPKWIEQYLKSPACQILILALVYFDILLASTEIAAANDTTTYHFGPLRTLILFIHAVEIIAQMIVLQRRFFNDWGHIIDLVLIATRVLGMPHSHHTGFLRAWRLIPLVETYLTIETSDHCETKQELSRQLSVVEEFKKKTIALETKLKEEQIARKQKEDIAMIRQDEIETLREALKIAAVEVAASMKSQEVDMNSIMSAAPNREDEDELRDLPIRSISPVVE